MAAEPALIRRREAPQHGLPATVHPVVARVLAARGLTRAEDLDLSLRRLLPPNGLQHLDRAVALLLDAIERRQRVVIAGDYDCDGATGVSVAVLGLRALGLAEVDYVVPDRLTMGYGLSPALVEQAVARRADLLVTVDNGIASLSGVEAARAHGLRVLITDHHLPGPVLPAADALVNPNAPGCPFGSKHLAGVGVMFYLLLGLRAALRDRGTWRGSAEPDLGALLDLVALGTVADLVSLDANNRVLVADGLRRIRAGRARPGIQALLQVAGRDFRNVTAGDLGFVLGPRINAAGRLDDIRIGIECLLAPDLQRALPLATELDHINRQRRELQARAAEQAQLQWQAGESSEAFGLALFDPEWHEGIVGLVAARLREAAHRPAIAFAAAQELGMLKGSARSVPGLHIRDVLAAVEARAPGLIARFGGHAMAAGLSLPSAHLAAFQAAFDDECRIRLRPDQLDPVIDSDGALDPHDFVLATAQAIEQAGPWGQGLPEPVFDGDFQVVESRLVGSEGRHVRYRFAVPGGPVLTAFDFDGAARRCQTGMVRLAYGLAIDRWQERESLQLRVLSIRPAG